VLRLNDSDVRPAHRGEFRVLVTADRTGLGQVRAYLAADILRRLSERSRLAPAVIDLLPGHADELRAVCAELNIHPPTHTLTQPVTLTGLFADGIREPVFDVGVRLAGEDAGETVGRSILAGRWIEVAGSVSGTGLEAAGTGGEAAGTGGEAAGSGGKTSPPLAERLGLGEEPLLVRMKLMRHGYGEPLGDGGDLGGTAKILSSWRELVARWARSPSAPMSRRYADAITAAFADNLNTAAALGELAALADDPGEPDGVKFETFAAADLLFGLDLARDIGR
jgi:hypothetical protein